MDLLSLIIDMKNKKMVNSIMIYTNNQGPVRWSDSIADYFSYKLNEKVFDKIIHAFKINGQIIEPERTSHEKIYSDLLNCTKIPKDTIIYFIDDVNHPKMINDNVYYVNVKPYHYYLPMNTLLSRYANYKQLSKEESQNIWSRINQSIPKHFIYPKVKSEEEHNVDILTGKLLITQMNDFFSNITKTIYKKPLSLKITPSNISLKKYLNKSKNYKTFKNHK